MRADLNFQEEQISALEAIKDRPEGTTHREMFEGGLRLNPDPKVAVCKVWYYEFGHYLLLPEASVPCGVKSTDKVTVVGTTTPYEVSCQKCLESQEYKKDLIRFEIEFDGDLYAWRSRPLEGINND